MSPRRQFKATLRDELAHVSSAALAIKDEWKGRAMPDSVFREFKRLVDRMEWVADQLDGRKSRERWSRVKHDFEIDPSEAGKFPASKSARSGGQVAGWVTIGDAIALSAGLENFLDNGSPHGHYGLFRTERKALVEHGGKLYVPLTKEERSVIEAKAVPTLGAGIIEPTRIPLTVQVLADQPLRLRDALVLGRTSSDSVSYLREESFTSGAAYQLAGSVKGEATAEYSLQTSAVQVLAVWVPVLAQQLADMGQLRALLDGRLRYDVRLVEEQEVLYGTGGANAFEGLLTVTGTQDIATADARITSPTIIDSIKVGQTEIRVAGYEADTLIIHPIDWEAVLLEKDATGGQYIGQMFPTNGGGFRLWGLRVIESSALELSTGERNLLVMDSKRAAYLWIREDLSVQVGMADDDFIRNKRRLLAEERAAFGIVAPAAVAVFQTESGA